MRFLRRIMEIFRLSRPSPAPTIFFEPQQHDPHIVLAPPPPPPPLVFPPPAPPPPPLYSGMFEFNPHHVQMPPPSGARAVDAPEHFYHPTGDIVVEAARFLPAQPARANPRIGMQQAEASPAAGDLERQYPQGAGDHHRALTAADRNPDNPDVPINFPNPDGFTREEIKLINSRFRQFFTTILIIQLGFAAIVATSIGASGFYIDACLGQSVLLFLFGCLIMMYPTFAAMRHKNYFRNVAAKVGIAYILFSVLSFIINFLSLGMGVFSRFSTLNPTQCLCPTDDTPVPAIEHHPILDTLSAVICLLVTALPLSIRPILELFDRFMAKENEGIQSRADAARIRAMSDELHARRLREVNLEQQNAGLIAQAEQHRSRAEASEQLNVRLRSEIAHHPHMSPEVGAHVLGCDGRCPSICQHPGSSPIVAPRTQSVHYSSSPRRSSTTVYCPGAAAIPHEDVAPHVASPPPDSSIIIIPDSSRRSRHHRV